MVEREETCQRQNDNVLSTMVGGQLKLDSDVAKNIIQLYIIVTTGIYTFTTCVYR